MMAEITRIPLDQLTGICILLGEGSPDGLYTAPTASEWRDIETGAVYSKTAENATSWTMVAAGSSAKPYVVQSRIAVGVGPISFRSYVTQGNYGLVAISGDGTTVTGRTITDTVGTTYSLVASITSGANKLAVYGGQFPASGLNTVTTNATNTFAQIGLLEVKNISSLTPNTTGSNYNSTSPATASLTTSVNGCLILVWIVGYHNAVTFTPGGTLQTIAQVNGSDAMGMFKDIQTTAGSYSVSITVAGAGADNAPVLAIAFPP